MITLSDMLTPTEREFDMKHRLEYVKKFAWAATASWPFGRRRRYEKLLEDIRTYISDEISHERYACSVVAMTLGPIDKLHDTPVSLAIKSGRRRPLGCPDA